MNTNVVSPQFLPRPGLSNCFKLKTESCSDPPSPCCSEWSDHKWTVLGTGVNATETHWRRKERKENTTVDRMDYTLSDFHAVRWNTNYLSGLSYPASVYMLTEIEIHPQDSLIHGAISRAVELEEKLRKNFANPLLQSVNLSLRPSCKSLPLNCFSILVKSVSLLSTSVSKMHLTLADRRTFNLSHNISLHYEWWQPSADVQHVRCKKKIQEI